MKRTTVYWFLIILLSMVAMPSFAAPRGRIKTNRAVVTFSPYIANNINSTEKLFEIFQGLMGKETEIAKSLENTGALWTISQSYNGIQICINSPKPIEELKETIDHILTMSLERIATLEEPLAKVEPVARLGAFISNTESLPMNNGWLPVTLRFYGPDGNEVVENPKNLGTDSVKLSENKEFVVVAENQGVALVEGIVELPSLSPIEEYTNLYKEAAATNKKRPIVQPVKKPILGKLLIWDGISAENFVSASFIKNRLVFDTQFEDLGKVEIFFTANSLRLLIHEEVEAKDNNLYKTHLDLEKKIENATAKVGPKEWQSWSSKIIEVFKKDSRDYSKYAMHNAWLKHWLASDVGNLPVKVTFKKPDRIEEFEVFSHRKEHLFNLGSKKYPSIYAAKTLDCDNGTYMSLCFEGHSKYINGIEDFVRESLQISVPMTIQRKKEDCLILSCFSTNNKVPTHLSRIKASVTEFLFRNFKITDLKKSIKIGIGAVSSMPAYELQGLLRIGWPPTAARYESRPVETAELFDLIKNTTTDEEVLKLRWKTLTASSEGRANILSVLACRNLTIDSWER